MAMSSPTTDTDLQGGYHSPILSPKDGEFALSCTCGGILVPTPADQKTQMQSYLRHVVAEAAASASPS